MNWIASIFIALLSGGLSLCVAGYIAALCVNWYRISGYGASGYFILAIALMGGIAGTLIGLLVSRFVGGPSAVGFFKGLGASWGILIGIAGIATLIAFLLADISPRLNGRYLDLEVEIRLPVGETNSPSSVSGDSSLTLGSVVNHVQRKSAKGDLNVGDARLENGRWIIPGSVRVFTMRGKRSIAVEIGGKMVAGFIVPLPARPGNRFEDWSEWEPRPRVGNWPDSEPSYRFRIHPVIPPLPPPSAEVVEAEQFAVLKPEAPLEAWLPYMRHRSLEERVKTVMQVVEGRPAELAGLIRSTNATTREYALSAVLRLSKITPEVSDAVVSEGHEIAEGVRRFNEMQSDDPHFLDEQVQLRSRFSYWKQAWWTVHQRMGMDGRPPVKEIYDLALVRSKGTSMDEIVINARVILGALTPKTNKSL